MNIFRGTQKSEMEGIEGAVQFTHYVSHSLFCRG